MEEMKSFSSAMLGVFAATTLGFGLALAEICQTFGQQSCQGDMACPEPAPKSLLNIDISLIQPRCRK
jgi:hypothetical protein